ncbi:MAG: response regulator [Clostridiales bacterium]|nr:response regulator [Clostridiales bacterium]
MIKVMIVDDEPFIRQGLRILIPWEQYGYKICDEAANGLEALELIKKDDFDLIITDIKMPKMGGIELIEYVNEHITNRIHFIILSGFYEFEYAKKAIKYGAQDYILKPVQKDELIRVLVDYKKKYEQLTNEINKKKIADRIVFDNHLGHLLTGEYSDESLQYIKGLLSEYIDLRYVLLQYDQLDKRYSALSHKEKMAKQILLYEVLSDLLGDNYYHAYKEPVRSENEYAIGFIYAKKISDSLKLSEREYMEWLSSKVKEQVSYGIILYIGQREKDIRTIADSYKSAKVMYSLYSVSSEADILYYDDVKNSISTDKYPVNKDELDSLIRVIEENDKEMIKKYIVSVYSHLKNWLGEPEIIKINLNYLLFNLINLTREIDSNIEYEEVHSRISKWANDWHRVMSKITNFQSFALEFAEYISQLRRNSFGGGVLKDIEREIIENYSDNLSLKTLSEKYYMNTAYLGQIFKKQFNMSFKDYLNNFRIERASELLIRTDEKIYIIADQVGFKNTDYFISKFVQLKGVTPLQFRKQFIQKDE